MCALGCQHTDDISTSRAECSGHCSSNSVSYHWHSVLCPFGQHIVQGDRRTGKVGPRGGPRCTAAVNDADRLVGNEADLVSVRSALHDHVGPIRHNEASADPPIDKRYADLLLSFSARSDDVQHCCFTSKKLEFVSCMSTAASGLVNAGVVEKAFEILRHQYNFGKHSE